MLIEEGRALDSTLSSRLAGASALALSLLVLLSGLSLVFEAGSAQAAPPASPSAGSTISIQTSDVRAVNNTVFGTEVFVPTAPYPAGSTTILIEEPLSATIVIGVGIKIVSSGTSPVGYPLWRVWSSGTLVANVTNVTGPLAAGSAVLLEATGGSGSGWWNFTANGGLIRNGSFSGTFTGGGVLAAAAFSASASPVSKPTLSVSVSGTSPGVQVPTVWSLGFYHSSITLAPGSAYVTAASGMQATGQDQNLSFYQDSLLVATNATGQPMGTYLWGLGGPAFGAIVPWTSSSPSALSNSGVGLNLTIPANATLGGDFCLTVTEPFSGGKNLSGALCALGTAQTLVSYVMYSDPNGSYQGEAPVSGIAGLGSLNLEVTSVGTGFWQVLLGGSPISIPFTGANIAVGRAASSATLAPSVSLLTGDGNGLSSGLNLSEGVTLQSGTTWTPAPEGITLVPPVGANVCAQGNSQNWLIPPGAIDLAPCTGALPGGVRLWNLTTTAPVLSLSVTGRPGAMTSLEAQNVTLYVNSSTGAGTTPQSPVLFSLEPASLFGSPVEVQTGVYRVTLTAPPEIAASSITPQLTAAAPNAVPATSSFSLLLGPGNLTLGYAPRPPTVLWDSQNASLSLWVNTSSSPGVPVSDANLSISATAGGAFSSINLVAPGEYSTVYSPPQITRQVNDTLIVQATANGFFLLQESLTVLLAPGPMSIAITGVGPNATSGSSIPVTLWANSTFGGALTASWSAVLSLPGLNGTDLLSNLTPGPSGSERAVLTVPVLGQTNTTTLVVTATAYGYAPGVLHVPLTVIVEPLHVTVTPAGAAVGGSTVPLIVTATDPSGSAVANVSVAFNLPYGAGTLSAGSVITGGNGTATVDWVPPSAGGTWSVLVTVQGPAGYASFSENVSLSATAARGTSPSPTGRYTPVVIFAIAVVVVVGGLLLWGYLRYRQRTESEHPKAPKGKRTKRKTPEAPPPGT